MVSFAQVLKDEEFEAIYTIQFKSEFPLLSLALKTNVGKFRDNFSLWNLNLTSEAIKAHVNNIFKIKSPSTHFC